MVDQTDIIYSLLETTEGLNKPLNLYYYSCMRFAFNFFLQLNQAAESDDLSYVIFVLATRKKNNIFLNNFALKKIMVFEAAWTMPPQWTPLQPKSL